MSQKDEADELARVLADRQRYLDTLSAGLGTYIDGTVVPTLTEMTERYGPQIRRPAVLAVVRQLRTVADALERDAGGPEKPA